MKQVIVCRKDLKLSKGKLAVQVSHAAVEATLRSDKEKVGAWRKDGMKKVVLKVEDEKELFRYQQLAKEVGLVAVLITDAGLTEVPPGTITCLGIGPDDEAKIDKVTGTLPML